MLKLNNESIIYLTKDNAVFSKTKGGLLELEFNNQNFKRVFLVRAFPFSSADCYISVQDNNNEEIGIIKDFTSFDDDTVTLLKEQLALRYFTPKITKILKVKDIDGVAYFECETDKGKANFSFRVGGEAVIRLSETRIIFNDQQGNRFEVADIAALSQKEQKKLDLYI